MGDGADMAMECMFDDDEAYCNGDLDIDTGEEVYSPMTRKSSNKVFGFGPCPICGGQMHQCSGNFGLFWGCNDFPKCKGTRGYL